MKSSALLSKITFFALCCERLKKRFVFLLISFKENLFRKSYRGRMFSKIDLLFQSHAQRKKVNQKNRRLNYIRREAARGCQAGTNFRVPVPGLNSPSKGSSSI